MEDHAETYGVQDRETERKDKKESHAHTGHEDVTHKVKAKQRDDDDELKSNDSISHSEGLSDSESEMDDDYDPLAGAGLTKEQSIRKLQSTLSMKKIKTVVFPIRLTRAEKRAKLQQFGESKKEDDGALMDDEADDEASIEDKTLKKLMEYYGHWFQFVIYILIVLSQNYLELYAQYQIGEWATDTSL